METIKCQIIEMKKVIPEMKNPLDELKSILSTTEGEKSLNWYLENFAK